MMPRAFFVKTSERATHDIMTSVDHYHHHHHHHQQQQQQQGGDASRFSFMPSFDQATMDDLLTNYGKLHFIYSKYYEQFYNCTTHFYRAAWNADAV